MKQMSVQFLMSHKITINSKLIQNVMEKFVKTEQAGASKGKPVKNPVPMRVARRLRRRTW